MSKKKKTAEELTQEIKEKISSGKMKITMAEGHLVNFHEDIKKKFLEEVLKKPGAFISDGTYLDHFPDWMPGVRLLTLEKFGVDIEPVMEQPLHEIFEYIAQKPKSLITAEELAASLGLVKKKK